MTEKLEGRRGEILRFAKGARNWLLGQMSDDFDEFNWYPPEGGKSAADIVSHVSWTVSAIISKLAYDEGVEIHQEEPVIEGVEGLKNEILMAYVLAENYLQKISDDVLDKTTSLPPPARLSEGKVETILRVIIGYHTIHHAGQMTSLLRRAREAFQESD